MKSSKYYLRLIIASVIIVVGLTVLIIFDEEKITEQPPPPPIVKTKPYVYNRGAIFPQNKIVYSEEWVTLSDETKCIILRGGTHSGIIGFSCQWVIK